MKLFFNITYGEEWHCTDRVHMKIWRDVLGIYELLLTNLEVKMMKMYALHIYSKWQSSYSINENNSEHNENINQSIDQSINQSMSIIHACGVNWYPLLSAPSVAMSYA